MPGGVILVLQRCLDVRGTLEELQEDRDAGVLAPGEALFTSHLLRELRRKCRKWTMSLMRALG